MSMPPERHRIVTAAALALFALVSVRCAAGAELWIEPEGRVLMELIGQVTNPSPASSLQYGYITAVDGLDPAALFVGDVASDASARLTFYNDATTVRATTVGPLKIVERTGTMTIYLRDEPGASFADPSSFATGAAVLSADFRHQVVLDTTSGSFTTVFACTVRDSARFGLDGRMYRLSHRGARFRVVVQGKSNPAGPGQFAIAGSASE